MNHLLCICVLLFSGWAKGKTDECFNPKFLSWEDEGSNELLASSLYSLSPLSGRGINRPQTSLCNSIMLLLCKVRSCLEFYFGSVLFKR